MSTHRFPSAPEFPGVAVCIGWQECPPGYHPAGGFWLYNLTRFVPGFCVGTTVTESTVRAIVAGEERAA
jgi:hypothetical protein